MAFVATFETGASERINARSAAWTRSCKMSHLIANETIGERIDFLFDGTAAITFKSIKNDGTRLRYLKRVLVPSHAVICASTFKAFAHRFGFEASAIFQDMSNLTAT